MRPCWITLLTDFGRDGAYAAEVTGVLARLAPRARLAEITHEVPPHDVRAGAFLLAAACHRFPRGTVHLSVVDPGVGGARRALVLRAAGHLFVGPDNGLLTLVAARDAAARAWEPTHPGLRAPDPHPTFHGRDLFAPVAAALANGLEPEEVGPEVADWERLQRTGPEPRRGGRLALPVLAVDRFGNVTLGLSRRDAEALFPGEGKRPRLALEGKADPLPFVRTYVEAPPGGLVLLWGSAGYLELALREARAAERVGARPGGTLLFSRA